ncbi:MAG: tetraacyldisaccharide 4'-kinase [Caulobacteraceae bacterium]|nr:tetraacyldisaccharide 4'-kinase [Caulobacteraceae bacterium]
MKLVTPRFWYVRKGAPAPLIRTLLRPASWLWAGATARRIARGRPLDPGVPVVCVGNLTMGGSGKTPVARALAAHIAGRGLAVRILTRGYGGRLPGPLRVDPERHDARLVGDEALMLATEAPVIVARDRAAGAAAAVADGARVIVMDDGHQNPCVKKTLSLVVVDGETRDGEWPFGDGAVFPAGPMREPLAAGLARADAVVVLLPVDAPAVSPALLALFAGKPTLIARLAPVSAPPAGPLLAFAGIGKPWKMERALEAAGARLADFAPLPDHLAYDEGLLRALARRAEALGASLLTSEKDYVRLPRIWRDRVAAWPVAARFEDLAALDALLDRTLSVSRDPPEPAKPKV